MTLTNLSSSLRALLLVAALAVLAAPALARGGSGSSVPAPDWFERYAAAHPFGNGAIDTTQAPDVLERYAAAHPFGSGALDTAEAPDVMERYAAAHPFGRGVIDVTQAPDAFERYAARSATAVLVDGRSPDTRDAAKATQLQVVDPRSPDARDAASKADIPTAVQSTGFKSTGFNWGDAGIGAIATALVFLLLVGSTMLLTRHRRRPGMPAM